MQHLIRVSVACKLFSYFSIDYISHIMTYFVLKLDFSNIAFEGEGDVGATLGNMLTNSDKDAFTEIVLLFL